MPISRPPSLQPSSAPAQRQQNGSGSGSGSGSLPRAAFSVVAGPKTNSPPPGLKITDTQQLELVRLDQQRHSLSFFTSPFRVLQYAVMFLGSQAVRVVLYVVSNRQLLLGIAIPSAIMFALHAIDHPLSGALGRFDALMLWYGYWLALGIASSIGLGAGLHTFVLFLGPHIAEATLSAYQCGDLNFSVRGPDAFQFSSVAASAAAGVAKVSIWRIYRKISAEALLWGAGTAIGELPPYFMARAAALSGRRNPELDAIAALTTSHGGPVLTIKERLMAGVYYILQEYGFWGIFLFASIPNPLFDLAGITCGHFLVPFSTFFGATFLGKSFVKSTIQSLLVITIFSKDTIERLLSLLAAYDENLYKVASKFVNKQIAALQRSHGTVEESSNIIGAAWNGVVAVMLLYFVMTIIESMAHSYLD
ncbi:hypothetical protein GQ42DRAFT_131251, partial [Ramicandelaber brevisporus]